MQPERVIPLALVADSDSRIQRQTFQGQTFVGPAVLTLIDNVTMEHCSFEAPEPDAIFIEVPEGKLLVGVIGLSQVTFSRCIFRNVAFVGTRENIGKFRAALGMSDSVVQPQVAEAPSEAQAE